MIKIVEGTGISVSTSDISAIIDATELDSITVDEITAGPVRGVATYESFTVDLQTPVPEYALGDDGEYLLVRITNVVKCSDESSTGPEDVTSVSVSHVARFHVVSDIEVTGAMLSAFVETNVFFFIYPYFRQLVNSITSDLGLPPVVLGYQNRNDLPYSQAETVED